jgi:hypothetical protein
LSVHFSSRFTTPFNFMPKAYQISLAIVKDYFLDGKLPCESKNAILYSTL